MKTVLVVDDEALIRMIVLKVLGKAGYKVIEAATGTAAIRAIEEEQERVDLLLSDLSLPDMHGTEVYNRLRAGNPDMRVLFMSGFSDRDPGMTPSDLGEHFLQKPFSLSELEEAVTRALV